MNEEKVAISSDGDGLAKRRLRTVIASRCSRDGPVLPGARLASGADDRYVALARADPAAWRFDQSDLAQSDRLMASALQDSQTQSAMASGHRRGQ